jgi:RNA polymerase sigma-70 factor, ECF subfamily
MVLHRPIECTPLTRTCRVKCATIVICDELFGQQARIRVWRTLLAEDMVEDSQLWERIRRGEPQAFDTFYREMGPRLLRYLRQIVGNRQAAEDVMQETFTQIWRRPNGFMPERGSLRAYLFGVGRKRTAEWWRNSESADSNTLEEGTECKAEAASLVGDAFHRLPEDQRSLLWLREVEGQSYAELAQILGIPVGTVRSRLFTAREELRKVWRSTPPGRREGA